MKVYEFEVGIWDRQVICVLANNENEACEIISKYRGRETSNGFITNVYDSPQVVSVITIEE